MAQKTVVSPDPAAIGDVSAPPFSVLPDPSRLFAVRAARLRALAGGHALAPYLGFLAGLAEAQHAILTELPEPLRPDAEAIARGREFQMPPLDRSRVAADPALAATFDRLFELARGIEQPKPAADALARVTGASPAGREPREMDLEPVGDGRLCPACGGAPSSSMVVGWPGAHGARFCNCFLCGTLWNVFRIKCVLCGSTEGISYQEVAGEPGTVKAETCDKCHGWVKILQQHKDPAIEPIAGDVASLGLDLLMREGAYRRGGFNPFLAGY